MKGKRTVLLLIPSIILFGSAQAENGEDIDYKPLSTELCKVWVQYRKLPNNHKFAEDQNNIRQALERLYRSQGKETEANFIEAALDSELAQAISDIDEGKLQDFPQRSDRKLVYLVSKQKNGNLSFASLSSDVGLFSIPPNSPYYRQASNLVGELKVGERKKVPALPFKRPLTMGIILNSRTD